MNHIDFINTDLPLFLKDKNLANIEQVTDKINTYHGYVKSITSLMIDALYH